MAFVKLDCGMLDSTLWYQKDQRDLFITALLMARPHELTETVQVIEVDSLDPAGWAIPPGWYGIVEAAGLGIVNRSGLNPVGGMMALRELCGPDPESRSQDWEGRRMGRVDGGYIVLNYDRYRTKDHTAAERSRRYRAKMRNSVATLRHGVTTRSVTQAEAEAEAEASTPTVVDRPPQLTLEVEKPNAKRRPKRPAPSAIGWKVWRELWGAKHDATYVDAPGDGKAVQLLASSAVAHADSRDGDRDEVAEMVLRHWVACYLSDDGYNGYLAAERHPLRALARDLNKYGLPWEERAPVVGNTVVQRSMARAAKLEAEGR